MPTFSVRLIINVPGMGTRTVDQLGITAPDVNDAVQQAKANITIRATLVQETAP